MTAVVYIAQALVLCSVPVGIAVLVARRHHLGAERYDAGPPPAWWERLPAAGWVLAAHPALMLVVLVKLSGGWQATAGTLAVLAGTLLATANYIDAWRRRELGLA